MASACGSTALFLCFKLSSPRLVPQYGYSYITPSSSATSAHSSRVSWVATSTTFATAGLLQHRPGLSQTLRTSLVHSIARVDSRIKALPQALVRASMPQREHWRVTKSVVHHHEHIPVTWLSPVNFSLLPTHSIPRNKTADFRCAGASSRDWPCTGPSLNHSATTRLRWAVAGMMYRHTGSRPQNH